MTDCIETCLIRNLLASLAAPPPWAGPPGRCWPGSWRRPRPGAWWPLRRRPDTARSGRTGRTPAGSAPGCCTARSAQSAGTSDQHTKVFVKWPLQTSVFHSMAVVRAFAHGAMGRRIDPSWGGPIELFLAPAIAPRLV